MIGLIVVDRLNGTQIREVEDVDCPILFGFGFLKVIVRQRDILALLVLEALNKIVRSDLFADTSRGCRPLCRSG